MTGLSRVGKVPPTPCVWYLLLHMFGITPPSRNSVSFSIFLCFSSFIRRACAWAPLHPTCILLRASNAFCRFGTFAQQQLGLNHKSRGAHGTLWVHLLVFACIWEASDMLGRVPCSGSPPKLRLGDGPIGGALDMLLAFRAVSWGES